MIHCFAGTDLGLTSWMQDDSLIHYLVDRSRIIRIPGHTIHRGVFGSTWGIRCAPLNLVSIHYIHFGSTVCIVIKPSYVAMLTTIHADQFREDQKNVLDLCITVT